MQLGDLDFRQLEPRNLSLAYALSFPFRLCVGREWKCLISEDDYLAEMTLRNIRTYKGEMPIRSRRAYMVDPAPYSTTAIAIMRSVFPPKHMIDALRSTIPKARSAYPAYGNNFFEHYENNELHVWYGRLLFKALRRLLLAYDQIDEQQHRLNQPFHNAGDCVQRACVTITYPDNYTFTDADISDLFNLFNAPDIRSMGYVLPSFKDYDSAALQDIGRAIEKQKSHVFYEFATESIIRFRRGDSIVALLMAAIALEGAHAAFVQHDLLPRIPGNDAQKVLDEYLRVEGITTLQKMTPYMLMAEKERPTADEIKACSGAISMRNAIIHSLRITSTGQYKTRKYEDAQLFTAYNAIMTIYRRYVKALEARILSTQPTIAESTE